MSSLTNNAPAQTPPMYRHSSAINSGSDKLVDLLEQEIAKTTTHLHSLYLRIQADIPRLRDEAESAVKERDTARSCAFETERLLQEKSAELQQILGEHCDFRCIVDVTNKRSAARIKELEVALSRSDSGRIKERDIAAAAQAELRKLNESLADIKRQHNDERDSLRKEAENTQTELSARIQQLEVHLASMTAEHATALSCTALTESDLEKARTEVSHIQGELSVVKSSLSQLGLQFTADGQTFTVTDSISRQISGLVDERQKANALSQTLASLHSQAGVDCSNASLPPDVLSPFSLPVFITAVKDWLTDALTTGHGWESLYRQKEQEAKALSEQLVQARVSVEEAKSEVRTSAVAAAKAEESVEVIKALLHPAGLALGVKDGKNRVIFNKELAGCIHDMRPTVAQLREISNYLLRIHPTCGIEGLLKVQEPKPSSPHHLLISTRKWLTVAQGIGSIFKGMFEVAGGQIDMLQNQVKDKDKEAKKIEERLMKRNKEIEGFRKRLHQLTGQQPSSTAQQQATDTVKPGPSSGSSSTLASNKTQEVNPITTRKPCPLGPTQASQAPVANSHPFSDLGIEFLCSSFVVLPILFQYPESVLLHQKLSRALEMPRRREYRPHHL
ncbi:hypothetical protein IW261DRAFT_674936 [Armillaria novae-zelandiae]|uniref:Uncharacterized protein n=1 Tax=Armillaria novae-zelandiae TaxID=153914 RepID=A0AA39NXL7_9AGAR|nr:hypothetical protein IW261DRAFT_674936 [Armillaria novae-zelandiae]